MGCGVEAHIYVLPMNITLPLDEMTVEEKLRVIEAVWENLLKREDEIPMPDWHLEILREREQLVAEGKASYIPWEQAKKEIDEMIRSRERRNSSAGEK
jgi:hypothetical protein